MLRRKMLRDIKLHRTQFLSILLMAFLGVFIYTGITGEYKGLQHSMDTFYEDTNFADVWLYGNGFTETDVEELEAMSKITEVERRVVLPGNVPDDNDAVMEVYRVEEGTISKPYTITGSDFTNQEPGIWLDDRYATAHDYAVGDTIRVTINGFDIEETIKGTIYSSEYVYMEDENSSIPDFSKKGFCYLSTKSESVLDTIPYQQLVVKTNVDPKTLEKDMEDQIDTGISVFLTRDEQPSHATFQAEIEQHQVLGDIFPVVFLAVALLTMLTTMTRIVNYQRTQIGTLKALGFKKRKIMRHYVSYGFVLSLIGSVLGVIVGPLTLPLLLYPSLSGFYTLPVWEPVYDYSFYLMAAITIALTTITTYFACHKVLRETPAMTLRPKAPKGVKRSMLEKAPFWKHFSFTVHWNYRDIFRNKVRSLMAIVGVLGCTSLLVAAFGMWADMEDMKTWQYEKIIQYESKLNIEEQANTVELDRIKEEIDGEFIQEGAIELRKEGTKKTGTIQVLDENTLLHFTDSNAEYMELPEEGISITYKMAKSLDVEVGDTIEWHLYGHSGWKSGTISAIYRHPGMQGITISKEVLKENNYEFHPTAILTAQTVTASYPEISAIISSQDSIAGWEALTETMLLMVVILVVAAIVLAVVVLYNLGILSLTEMERDLATLKVIGFKTKKLQYLLLIQNLWLSCIGFVIGVPTGKWLIDVMLESMGDNMDMTNFIKPTTVGISFAIVIVLAILVNLMFYRKLKRVNMVEALKGVE